MPIAKEKRMETGTLDVHYRSLESLNYSSIVKFEKSPAEFVEEFIMGIEKVDEDTASSLIGTLCDDILLTYKGNMAEFEEHFDENYCLMTGEKTMAQTFTLSDELFKLTIRDLNGEANGEEDGGFVERFKEAFDICQRDGKFKGKTWEKAMELWRETDKNGNNAQTYFKTRIEAIGKKVVSLGLVDRAQGIASNALTDDFTASLFNFQNVVEDIEKLPKFPITFTYKGIEGEIEGKLELDLLIINHLSKTIQPWDLKCVYDNTLFPYSYLKNRYYIQAVWYTIGLVQWAKENKLGDYRVLPFKFVVLDTSKNNRRPLKYCLKDSHLQQGFDGFEAGGRTYKGVRELVESILWAKKNGMWTTTKEAFINAGEVNLIEF